MILIDGARDLELVRGGDPVRVQLDPEFGSLALGNGEKEIMAVRLPFYVDTVRPGMNAAKSDLRKGDRILAVDGTPTLFFEDFRKLLQEKKDQTIAIALVRGPDTLNVPVTVDASGLVGIGPETYSELEARGLGFKTVKESYGLLASIPAGINVWHGNTHGLREFHEVALHEVRCRNRSVVSARSVTCSPAHGIGKRSGP